MEEKLQQLHRILVERGIDNKPYREFRDNFINNPDKQRRLHEILVERGVDNKKFEEFQSNFFPVQKKNRSGKVSAPGPYRQSTAHVAGTSSTEQFDPASLWGAPTPGIKQPSNATSLGIETSPSDGVVDPKFVKRNDQRIALSRARDARNGDYQSDAIERMERSMSEKERAELARTSLIEGDNAGVTNAQYQAQLNAIKKDQTDLVNGLDGIDQEILESLGDNAFDQYEQNISRYTTLREKYDAAAKSKDPTAANKYVDELNDLQSEIEKFQQHPLVQERNQMVGAMKKNLDRFISMETDERYKTVKSLEADRKAIQGQVDNQDWMSDFSGMVVRGIGNMAAGVGRMPKNINEMVWGEDAEPTPISNFLIDIGEGANFLFPSPSQYSRGLVTDTAKWGELQVDFKGDEIQSVRWPDGRVMNWHLTDEQISEIKGLERSKQMNWSVAPYQAANVIVDMGIMLAGADKITKGLTAFKVGEKAAARTGVALSTAGQMSNGMYEQGLELFDGDKKKATEFSFFGSLAVGAVQNVFGMEQRLLTGRVLDTKSIAAAVGKMTPKQMGLEFGKMYAKEVAGEGFEEGLIEPLVTAAASYTIGGKADLDPTEMVSNGAMGLMVGTLFAGGNLNLNELQKSSLYNASKDPVAFGNALRKAVGNGSIKGDEEFISQQVSRVNRIGAELSRLAPDLKQEELLDATAVIDQKIQAEARLKNAKGNEELEKRYQAEVDVLNGHLNGMMRPPTKQEPATVKKAVVEVNGKIYEGDNHAQAILNAKKAGEDISKIDRQRDGKFLLSDGTVIDRAEAMNRFGKDRSEMMIEQDQAADEANREYRKLQEQVSTGEAAKEGEVLSPAPVSAPAPITTFEVGQTYHDPVENRDYIYKGENEDGMLLFDKVPKDKKEVLFNTSVDAVKGGLFTNRLVATTPIVAETTANMPTGQSVSQEPIQTGSGTPPVPPIAPPDRTSTTPDEPGMVDKKIVNERAYKGDVRQEIKDYLEKKGLKRDVENRDEAIGIASNMVNDLGVDKSIEAVKMGEVEGGVAAAVIFKSLVEIDAAIAASTDPKEIDYLSQKYADITAMLDEEGVTKGRFIGMLGRMYMDSDLGWNANIKKNEYVKRFGSISPEVEAKFEELESQLKEVSKRLAEAEKRAAEAAEKATIETIKTEAAKRAPKTNPEKELAKKKIAEGKAELASAISRLTKATVGKTSALIGLSKEQSAALGDIFKAVAKITKGGIQAVKIRFKKEVSPYMDADAAWSHVEEKYANDLKDDSIGKLKVPKSLIRDLVAGGIDNVPDLVAAVRSEMGLETESDREIRDAITEYEKVINMTKDDIGREVSRLKTLGKLMSKIEDAMAGIRPKRTGLQRPQFTEKQKAQIRGLERKLREEVKNLPTDTATAAGELLSRLDAKKNRIRNRIEDIKKAIREGKVIERNGTPLLTDQEIADLEAELKQQEEAYETAFADILAEAEEKRRLENAKKSTRRSIEELERRIREKDFAKKKRKPLIEDSELTDLRAKKLRIKEEYDKEFYKEELKNRSSTQKKIDVVRDIWGISRPLLASLDGSVATVQGGILGFFDSPARFVKALRAANEAMRSDDDMDNFIRRVKSQDWYPLVKQMGIAITETRPEARAKEEIAYFGEYISALWDTASLIARPFGRKAYEKAKDFNLFKITERASAAFLDTLRIEKAISMIDGPLKGKSFSDNKEEFKSVGGGINTMTSRTSLGPAERMAPFLTDALFSPRNSLSQIKLFSPYAIIYLAQMTPTARKMTMMALGKYIAGITSTVLLAAVYLNNDDDEDSGVEFDPRSSEFMKPKVNGIVHDPWGGRMQHVTFAARLFMDALYNVGIGKGGFKNADGEVMPLGVPYKSPKAAELWAAQITNKLHPSAGLYWRYADTNVSKDGDRTSFGKEYDFLQELRENSYMMIIQTAQELEKDGFSFMDSITMFLAFWGMGVRRAKSKKPPTPEEMKKEKEEEIEKKKLERARRMKRKEEARREKQQSK